MRTVLLAVDGSSHAFEAALYLIDFTKKHGPLVVHVVHIEPKPFSWQTQGMEPGAIQGHLAARAHIATKPVLNAFNEAGVVCHEHVRMGDIAETIITLADELGCDAIVIGTRGLGAISGLALGSVTTKVLHLTTVPVICIKSSTSEP